MGMRHMPAWQREKYFPYPGDKACYDPHTGRSNIRQQSTQARIRNGTLRPDDAQIETYEALCSQLSRTPDAAFYHMGPMTAAGIIATLQRRLDRDRDNI